nr:GDSL-type esterase/lipase family protein [Myxococcota bacterium]
PYRHRDVEHRASESWQLREITRNHDSTGWYGFGGIQYRGRPGATAHFATVDEGPVGREVSRFLVYYQKHERGGAFEHRVDGGAWTRVEAVADPSEDAVLELPVPTGAHALDLRFAGGQPRLYGVALEREGPGVVYDSLGLVGARASRLLYFDAEHVARQLRLRGTHLVVLGFGGNEAEDNIRRDTYQTDYREVIRRMRGGREDLGCLVFAPLDQGERDARGRVVTMENLPVIVEAQRAAAAAEGCAFFDTLAAMGGRDAIGRWLRWRLASGDLRHMTPSGYERVADAFHRALLRGFAEWLDRQNPRDDGAPDATAGELTIPDAGSITNAAAAVIDAGSGDAVDAGVSLDAGTDAGRARRRRAHHAR